MDHEKMLSWADRQLRRVEASANRFMRKKPYITAFQPDLKTRTDESLEYDLIVWLRRPIEEPPEDAPFLVGEALHAMRVSLDYLAMRVVTKANPGVSERKVAFPIFTDADEFCAMKGRRIPGVTGELFDLFHSAQPYLRRHGGKPSDHPLAVLDALEQPHKHRSMLTALPGLYSMAFRIEGDPADSVCLWQKLPVGPFSKDEHTKVARFRCAMASRTKLKAPVHGDLRFFVCFDKRGPAHGANVVSKLKEIRDHIRNDVFPAFKDYL
jgi:hypothetical protein